MKLIWIYHPESECVFSGNESDLESDGLLSEVGVEEAARFVYDGASIEYEDKILLAFEYMGVKLEAEKNASN